MSVLTSVMMTYRDGDKYLYLNISKTKEMCIDVRKCKVILNLFVYTARHKFERVSTHKCLGVAFDSFVGMKTPVLLLRK